MQRPEVAFTEPALKSGVVALTPLGMPAVASGQNVVVFKMETSTGQRAVRCFINPPGQGDQRYAALAQYVSTHGCRALSGATWIEQGVQAKSRWWPVVVMAWESGRSLTAMAEDLLDRPDDLRLLARNWIEAVHELQAAGIAHGDLQHGNVLVNPDMSVRLVDLDGVWVPNQTTGPPAENGHPNYQHPARAQNDWGRHVDSFSALLIYVSLVALAADPALERFMAGENLILVRDDLQRPDATEVWRALAGSPDVEVCELTTRLAAACRLPTPPLVSLAELLGEVGESLDETVVRPPVITAPADGAGPLRVRAAASGDWWKDPGVGAAAPVNGIVALTGVAPVSPVQVEPKPQFSPGRGAAASSTVSRPESSAVSSAKSSASQKSVTVVPASPDWVSPTLDLKAAESAEPPAADSRRGFFTLVARNAPISGGIGGAVAGYLGAGAYFLVDSSLPDRFKSAPMLVLVGLFLGAVLNGWQAIAIDGLKRAIPKILLGGAVGAIAGTVALVPVDLMRDHLLHDGQTKSVGLVMMIWIYAALLVGLAAGLLRSRRAALAGTVGGLVGGALGGLLHGATTAKFNPEGRLLLDTSPWTTTLIIMAVAGIIGLSIGVVSRALRRGSLTAIEGRMKGVEVLVDRRIATIGSHRHSTMTIDDSGHSIAATHIAQALHEDGTSTAVFAGPAALNGERLHGSYSDPIERQLSSGAVMQVGQSFIRFDRHGK